ncbi:MAG: NAD-dependent epimerase/dehydratase family protein [bacterium]|nr:NAD-dependent epimerase/dehydratase family protein [bacterium]
MATVFFTGFPGFLGSELLPRVLERRDKDRAVCLVQPKFVDLAEQRVADLTGSHRELAGRIDLVCGDITEAGLGLENPADLAEDVSEIFHLAAVYDLMVRRPVAVRINVDGTRHMLDFAEQCPQLERFQYVSTCYVSGRYAGIFREGDLDLGQDFNNYYEETKFLAEIEVQARMDAGLPATIYRPAVVVGDSETGATQKYDGPYFVIRWLLRQPALAVLPVVGDPTAVRVNLVPRDFVIDAIAYLSGQSVSLGEVYQLADPKPLTVDELIDLVGDATRRRVLKIPSMRTVAKAALDYLPGAQWLMQIPSAAIDYFAHPTHYTTDNTIRDLEGTGIEVPRLDAYMPHLVAFVREHPDVGSKAMI